MMLNAVNPKTTSSVRTPGLSWSRVALPEDAVTIPLELMPVPDVE
jgi:hypothetical protein